MDDEENIQNSLVDILTKFDNENNQELIHTDSTESSQKDWDYICTIVKTNKSTKILRLAVQTLEKCCTKKPDLIFNGGLKALIHLTTTSSERAIKIVCAQTYCRILRILVQSIESSLDPENESSVESLIVKLAFCEDMIPETEALIKLNSADNVICRSLKDSLDCLQKCVEHHAEYKQYMQPPVDDNDIIESKSNEGDFDEGEQFELKDEYQNHVASSSSSSYQHDKPLINLGSCDPTILNEDFAEEIINRLTNAARHGVGFLYNDVPDYRWLEIQDKLKVIWKASTIKPITLERQLNLSAKQVDELMIASGFFCKSEHYINFDNYKKLTNAVLMLSHADFYSAALRVFDIKAPRLDYPPSSAGGDDNGDEYRDDGGYMSSRHHHRSPSDRDSLTKSRAQPSHPPVVSSGITHRAPDGTLREHDNATPFLLIRNLPLDVTSSELLILLRKTSGCGYLDSKDIIIPPSHRHFKDKAAQTKAEAIGGHAYVNFQHIKDARLVRNELNGKMFGGRPLEIEYSLGRPNRSVWIGAVPAELSQEQIERCMQRYGPVQRIDLRRRKFAGDAFAFAVYDRIEDAIEAVKNLAELGNLIDGNRVRIGFSSSSVDQNLAAASASSNANTSAAGNGADYNRRDRKDRERGSVGDGVRMNRDEYESDLSPRDSRVRESSGRSDGGPAQGYRERYSGRDSRDRDAGFVGAGSGGGKGQYEYESQRYPSSRDRYPSAAPAVLGAPYSRSAAVGSTADYDRVDPSDNVLPTKTRWDSNRGGMDERRTSYGGPVDTGNYSPGDMHKKEYHGSEEADYDYYNESSSRAPVSAGASGYRRPSYQRQQQQQQSQPSYGSGNQGYNEAPVAKRRMSDDGAYSSAYSEPVNSDREYKRGRPSAGGGGYAAEESDRYHPSESTAAAGYRHPQPRGMPSANSAGYSSNYSPHQGSHQGGGGRLPPAADYPEYGQPVDRPHSKQYGQPAPVGRGSSNNPQHGYGNNHHPQQQQAPLQSPRTAAPPSAYYNR